MLKCFEKYRFGQKNSSSIMASMDGDCDAVETIQEIQSYFTSFNKDMQQNTTHVSQTAELAQVYIDEAGHYFYQTLDGQSQPVVVVAEDPDEDEVREIEEHTISSGIVAVSDTSTSTTTITEGKCLKTSTTTLTDSSTGVSALASLTEGEDSNGENVTLQSTTGVVAQVGASSNEEALRSFAGALAKVEDQRHTTTEGLLQVLPDTSGAGGHNQVILNTGTNNQIVTIVPSNNPNELSYVLIVEQNSERDASQTSKDDAVYDFNEVDDSITFSEDEEDSQRGQQSGSASSKMTRINSAARRSQASGSQPHMCNYCNYTSTKRYLLNRHMRSHSEERPHKCSVCDRGFKTLASLQNHLNTHTGVKPHRCKFCDTGFTTSGELIRHTRYIHTLEKPHKCPECDYCSVELSKLKRHMRCHTGERPYQCIHCTYASPDTFKLKRHLRIHTGEKPYECDLCHARFTQSNSLKAHKLIHTGNKPIYTCDLCPTTCGRKTDLRIHIQKLHTSDKPIKCKKCTKMFPDRYTFKLHNRTHDGEKCFKCDLCPYASTSSRHLDSHMLVHTEQKPYRCEMCEQSFRQKQLLRRHQNLYHNPAYIPPAPREKTQECPECGKAFRHKGNLIRHMAIHDPDASAQEKAQALRVGRQKRLQLINGEEVEIYTNDGDEDEELLPVDNNQYVVLEVIQLQDGSGHHVMMGDGLPLDTEGNVLPPSPLVVPQQDPTINSAILGLKTGPTLMPEDIKKETKKEVDTCFGFDEDGEASQIHLQFGD